MGTVEETFGLCLSRGRAPGPIYLQRYGNKIEFRNIWLLQKKQRPNRNSFHQPRNNKWCVPACPSSAQQARSKSPPNGWTTHHTAPGVPMRLGTGGGMLPCRREGARPT